MGTDRNQPQKPKKYSFLLPAAVLLVAVAVLTVFALSRMEGYIVRSGEQSMASVTEQLAQSYDLQLGRMYDRLSWVQENLFHDGNDVVVLSKEQKNLLNATLGSDFELVFIRENGQMMNLDGQTMYLDLQASSLLALRQGEWVAQTVFWDTGSARQMRYLVAMPCSTYSVEGKSFASLGLTMDRSAVDEMLALSGFGGEAKLFTVDENRTVLYTNQEGDQYSRNYDLLKHLLADGVITQEVFAALSSDFAEGSTGTVFVDYDETPLYIGYQPLAISKGEMVIIVPASVTNGALMDYQEIAVQMIVAIMMLLVLLCLALLYSISRVAAAEERARFEEETRRIKEEAMEALEFERDRADRANRAKSTFLSNMSHDIRTPMNAIVGFTSLAITHIDDKKLLEDYLGKICTSSEHLLSLINDILDMSRIESGKVKINETPCSIPAVAHELRNILLPSINAKRLNFFIDTVDVEHEDVICDKLRMNQVLFNIAGNAIKFTPPGGTVSVRFAELPNAPSGFANFQFTVKDTGIGMNPEFLESIFDPFTRERSSTVSKVEGTGLGMAITKNVVDMMGGTITVTSAPGEGSEFVVSLRFKTMTGIKKDRTIPELKGFRALVADDNMDSCGSVAKMLRTIGMRPEWTTSGKEAVYRARMASEELDPFRVYIIDWLMPDMNGVEVVRRIRADIGEDVPIVILTAYDWTDIEDEARAAGVTAFCSKPLFLSDLYDVLKMASDSDEPDVPSAFAPMDERFCGKRVLLVEDVDLNREIVESILDEAGIACESVDNGQKAVAAIRDSEPGYFDLVLMDVMMPEMDGYQATRAIRGLSDPQRAGVPIIAMTANAFEEDRQAALETGMNDHLSKPFKTEDLYAAIKRFL